MKKNDLLTLTADGLGADLEGVCRADGMAVFVPGMLPGETARVRIVKVQPRFAFGRMEGKPLTASPARKVPDCAAYPRCGGCMGRHMTYETTLEAKRQQVQDCFRRIGHIDIDVPPRRRCPLAERWKNPWQAFSRRAATILSRLRNARTPCRRRTKSAAVYWGG